MENFVSFNLYNNAWRGIEKMGNYIFYDPEETISGALPFLVFHFVTNYNLEDLELFFKLAGFTTFKEEEIPHMKSSKKSYNLPNERQYHAGWFGGFTDEESAKKYIESELGEGIIAKFLRLKKELLLQEKDRLLDRLGNIEQEIQRYEKLLDSSKVTR